MSYGDYNGPDKPNKGQEGGACNRQRCQAEPALFYNHGSMSWYCRDCKIDIGDDHVNKMDWDMRHRPRLGHAQFETREEMDERKKREEVAKAALPPTPPSYDEFFPDGLPTKERYKSPSLEKFLRKGKQGKRV